jgi:hypothetical protein
MADHVSPKPVGLCGHPHQLWSSPVGHREVGPVTWRVIKPVEGHPPADDPGWEPVRLEPGTRLRHVQSDWTLQGCAGCEDLLTWERFLVLDGPEAGRCIEFALTNPRRPDDHAIPKGLWPA